MKNKLGKNNSPLIMGLLLTCAITTIVALQFKVFQRGYDHFILDNRNHYLSCRDLPPKIEVERITEQQQVVIQQIQRVAPGFVGVEIDSKTCDGKADLYRLQNR
jgi:hypothetical protein